MMEEGWFFEKSFLGQAAQGYKIKEILHSEQSQYQKIDVLDTYALGKLLLLDGKTMVSDLDEFVYHECMAHVPYMIMEEVKNVLIIGGGDGGVVTEFTRHPEIQNIHLVEIDERVIEVSKKYFPKCTKGLSDPRVKIMPQDGIEFIKSKEDFYDIIIVDSTDPEDFASGLFTKEFYSHVNKALTSKGIMMNQTENPFFDEYGVKGIYDNLRAAFPIVSSFYAPMIIYPGVFWTFGISSKFYRPENLRSEKMSHMLNVQSDLLWYNTDWHKGALKLSNFQKRKLGIE